MMLAGWELTSLPWLGAGIDTNALLGARNRYFFPATKKNSKESINWVVLSFEWVVYHLL